MTWSDRNIVPIWALWGNRAAEPAQLGSKVMRAAVKGTTTRERGPAEKGLAFESTDVPLGTYSQEQGDILVGTACQHEQVVRRSEL